MIRTQFYVLFVLNLYGIYFDQSLIFIMRIPEQKIEEIRTAANIVDIISGYIPLRKRGHNFIGLCPFHQEKTPSFTVSEDKNIFHCFGCHAGGNVFKFLMDYKNISFVEAVEEVAAQVGIAIDYEKGYSSEEQDEIEEYYDINVLAARFFSNNLLKSDSGEIARRYFERRKIKLQTQRNFGLGYAPDSWDSFFNHARENKIDLLKAKELGLLDAKDGGSFYDKFRDRVIFPIFSPNGRVIAFGGRILTDRKDTAKYLNSPESKVYQKRKTLYGLYQSKDEIRRLDKALLVEGYMDLISLYQNGVKNVVASSGTALTEEQVQLLSRFTKNIIIIFDADPAGQKASLRSIEILLKQDFDVKVLALPDGEDPDTYINKFTKDDFDRLVNNAKHFLEYQTEQFEKSGDLNDPTRQSNAIRELVKNAALVSDELKRSILIKSIARKFNLREMLLEKELDKFLNANNQQQYQQQSVKKEGIKKDIQPAANRETAKGKRYELDIVRLLLSDDKKIIGYIFDHINSEDLENDKLREIAMDFFEAFKKGISESANLLDGVKDDDMRTYLRSLMIDNDSISKKWETKTANGTLKKDSIEYAVELVRNYRIFNIDKEIKINNEHIALCKDEAELRELMERNKELQAEKIRVKSE